jgi:protocatechuate 3,4-dioxygenase beta subunit
MVKIILNFVYILLIFSALFLFSQVGTNKWDIVIAGEQEPGERIIVSGTVYDADGKTVLPGITIYAYHTNAKGIYGEGEELLDGTMITNSSGQYKFSTIKPGSYPERRNPAHIHFKITGNEIEEQWLELRFEGDLYIPDYDFKNELSKGNFSQIQKLVKNSDGILACKMDIKLEE